MPDPRIFTTNDRDSNIAGKKYDLDYITSPVFINGASGATGSATNFVLGTAKASGILQGFYITVNGPALSASGFISGSISATCRINSAAALASLPAVAGPASASGGFAWRVISGAVDPNSARVVPGDLITGDYVCQSGGSAAAGAAATGFTMTAILRYDAV